MTREQIMEMLKKITYEIHMLKLGDADSIVIRYKGSNQIFPKIIVIDAGNVGDSKYIKDFIFNRWGAKKIDLAICTHPDKDHKGGFFDLLDDKEVTINKLWALDPYLSIRNEEYDRYYTVREKKEITRTPFNHPTDGRNLIEMAEQRGIFYSPSVGDVYEFAPLKVVGPDADYYHEAALGMCQDYKEIEDDPDTSVYDELAEVSSEDAKSVIDEDNDTSYTNQSSLILLLSIPEGSRFLFTGDCSSQSLMLAHEQFGEELERCVLKVPHHGSRHNMTTVLIDELKPSCAAISAKGSKKHPNKGLVYWLSKHCDVYSTHKGEFFWSNEPTRNKAKALKEKQK